MNDSANDRNTDPLYKEIRSLLEHYNNNIVAVYLDARKKVEDELKHHKQNAEELFGNATKQVNIFKVQCGISKIPQNELKGYFGRHGSFRNKSKDIDNELEESIKTTKDYYSIYSSWMPKNSFLMRVALFVGTLIFFVMLEASGAQISFIVPLAVAFAIAYFVPNYYSGQKGASIKENYYNAAAKTSVLMDLWLELREEEAQEILSKAHFNYWKKLKDINKALSSGLDELNYQYTNVYSKLSVNELPWSNSLWREWSCTSTAPKSIRFGNLLLSNKVLSNIGAEPEMDYVLPALAPLIKGKSFLLKGSGIARDKAIEAVQSVLFRLLASFPPGKVKYLLIDPVGLGQNVSAFMSLADHEDSLITSRAWSEPQHIQSRLTDITEHMETVIQKYLRREFDTIADYNLSAGEIAEPYIAIVVMDFPVNFNEDTARRLQSIAQNGPRCGVYTFVVNDTEKILPYGFNIEELERACEVIAWENERFVWKHPLFKYCNLEIDQPPDKELSELIINKVGKSSGDSMKVEVPFSRLLKMAGLEKESWWTGSVNNAVKLPLGPSGARRIQHLLLGDGTEQHALIVGRPGSGKSNLMHIIIITASLLYSPSELNFYLVDFKEGVEFKPYAEMPPPHVRVVAVESEREFGLSVLKGINDVLERRGDAFRQCGAKGIAEYRRISNNKMPRIILMVDEFQMFFINDDAISSESALILDRLVRQGRAFGIHVVLGSQTLAGAYSLPRNTLDLMAVRIALQSSDADSRLILAEDNPAARLLARPGEAIYNAASGLVEGNNLFQVALFSDEDRIKYLKEAFLLGRSRYGKQYKPIVFEGNKPATLNESKPIKTLIKQKDWPKGLKSIYALLGEPIAIKHSTAAKFRRQSGSHLLIVAREEAEAMGLLTSSILSLSLQHHPDDARFLVVNFSSADEKWAEILWHTSKTLPHKIELIGRRDLPEKFSELATTLNKRNDDKVSCSKKVFLFIVGLHRAKDLHIQDINYGMGAYDESNGLSLNEQFMLILREGPEVGIHIVSWCDTCGNLMKALDRHALGEFTMRAAGRMSSDDSILLLDNQAASKLDKPHRMIFFDEDKPGCLEKFRPYSAYSIEWLTKVGEIINNKIT